MLLCYPLYKNEADHSQQSTSNNHCIYLKPQVKAFPKQKVKL